jgi:hypothetical protein
VLFGWLVVTTLSVVRPRQGWLFSPSGAEVFKSYVQTQPVASRAQAHYGLALEMDRARQANTNKLDRMLDALELATILIGLEILAWITELAS